MEPSCAECEHFIPDVRRARVTSLVHGGDCERFSDREYTESGDICDQFDHESNLTPSVR